jgi:hypothetical protein
MEQPMNDIDIEVKIAEALRARPDAPVHMDALRARAVAKSRRTRLTRRAATGVGVGLAFAVTAAVVAAPRLVLPHQSGSGVAGLQSGNPALSVRHQGPTTLPGVNTEPSALEDPSRVGADRGLLHFDVDLAALHATSVEWTSGLGYERVDLGAGTGNNAEYHAVTLVVGGSTAMINRGFAEAADGQGTPASQLVQGTPEAVTVGGQPATLQRLGDPRRDKGAGVQFYTPGRGYWVLRWQPVAGLQAELRVNKDDRQRALNTAEALLFDRVQRCLSPVRLTSLPGTAVVSRCDTTLTRNAATGGLTWSSSNLWVAPAPATNTVTFYLSPVTQRVAHDLAQFNTNATVAGHPASWRTASPAGLWILKFGPYETFTAGRGLTKQQAIQYTQGLIPTGDPTRPDTWPVDNLH